MASEPGGSILSLLEIARKGSSARRPLLWFRRQNSSPRQLLRLLYGPLDNPFGVERVHAAKARNEKAVKCLKTNNPAKSMILPSQ
jgi:hypothetical protein